MSLANIYIEKALIQDAAEILKLQKLAYQSEIEIYNDPYLPPAIQTLEEIQTEFKFRIFLKLLIGNQLIGSVRVHEKDGTVYIGKLIVHPDWRGRGLGQKLMRFVETLFPNAERFELFTGHKSERNLYLYQKLGYRIFKREKADDNLEIVYMEKLNSTS